MGVAWTKSGPGANVMKLFASPPNEGIAQHMVLMPSVEQKIENNDATFMQIDAVKLSIAFKIAYYCCS